MKSQLLRAASSVPVVGRGVTTRLIDGRHGVRIASTTAGFVADCRLALEHAPDLITVDVFETILARRLVGQRSIEHAIATRLVDDGIWPGTVDDYLAARVRAAAGVTEGRLQDWYQQPALASVVDADGAVQAELDVEKELTHVVAGARDGLDLLADSNVPVLLLSDMYLSHEELWQLLNHHGLADTRIPLMVSADHGVSKQSGELYALARRGRVSEGAATFVHIGNNAFIDGAMAVRNGVDIVFADRANPSRCESIVGVRPGTMGPAIAGAARRVRLERSADGTIDLDRTAAIEAEGTQIVGQMMAAFLFWVRETVESSGHEHLAFLARDGELPYLMAQAMPADHWKDFDLRYLHSSRATWSLASATAVGVDEWIATGTLDRSGFLHQLTGHVPLAALLKRIGLAHDDVPKASPLASLDPTVPITEDQFDAWCELLDDSAVRNLIEQRSIPRRDEILDYLSQSGLPSGPMALIDVGWRGQVAWMVSALIGEATGHEPLHLHFGGDGVMAHVDERIDIRRFALDDSRWPHPIDSPVSCVEMFLAAGKARLLGYERHDDGTVSQRFAEANSAVHSSTIQGLWDGAIALASELPSREQCREWGITDTSADGLTTEIRGLLEAFWNRPDKAEIETLAGLLFEHDSSGDSVGSVIAPYRWPELRHRDPLARQWRAGSLLATPPLRRSAFRAAYAVSNGVSRLRR